MIDKSKQEIKRIEKILEKNMEDFPVCSRVVVTDEIEELSLHPGNCGTVFSIDEMGNITVCWDDLTVTTTNYMSREFLLPNIFTIFNDTASTYSFYGFIESLRNTFQRFGLYVEGCTKDLKRAEIERVITFSLDKMMNDTFNGYSFLTTFSDSGEIEKTELSIYDNTQKMILTFDDIMSDPYKLTQIFNCENYSNEIQYLKRYYQSINNTLKSL